MSTHRPPSAAPIWKRSLPTEHPALTGEIDLEILVVGGGITGVTLAYTLAEQGSAVGLLEAHDIAGAATGRNAGFLLGAPGEPYRELIELWGRDGARAVIQMARRSHQRIRELVETLGLDCDYRCRGSLRLARTPEEAEDQRASLADLHADGLRTLETPLAAVVPESALDRFAAAFVTPEDGEVDPVRFVDGLAQAAVRKGAQLFTRSAVERAHWNAGLWDVRTPAGIARSRTLVLATNAWTPRLVPALAPLIAPRRGQMLATAPVGHEVTSRPTLAHWGYQFWRQLPDSRILIGGWRNLDLDGEVGYEDHPTDVIQHGIEQGLRELVPEPVAIEHRWAGTMGFARDGRPLVGWLDAEHHLAICGAYTGHGMGLAAGCTLELAALLSWRNAPGIASFDPGRFPELRRGRENFTRLDRVAEPQG
jgi:glycine/D-amino acid oxidase-like deaminating enzyme